MRVADFIVADITPKPGTSLRYLHMDVNGSPCYIEDIEVGTRALIMYQPDYDDRFHRLHTSVIENIERSTNDSVVKITTMNTIYTLTRTNFNDETYGGLPCLTEEAAEQAVRDYVSDGAGKKLMETIYKDQEIDYEVAAKSLLYAVKWLGETRDGAMYHVFADGMTIR